jgi:ABC-type multidrug transport system ATPase subunit
LSDFLTTTNLTKWIIKDLSLSISSGEICGLVGINGSGKTTLSRLLLGLLDPEQGSSTLLGVPSKSITDEIKELIYSLTITCYAYTTKY